jgi:hypothetical protein
LRAGGADAFEENRCGLGVGVLGDKCALERLTEDGFAETGRAAEVHLN